MNMRYTAAVLKKHEHRLPATFPRHAPALSSRSFEARHARTNRGKSGCGDNRDMGVIAVLEIEDRPVRLPDPSGGTFNAAGDFDSLIPFAESKFSVLSKVDPYGDTQVARSDLAALRAEIDLLVKEVSGSAERHGLLRLRALVDAARDEPAGVLRFIGD
jgi:hypothetical protein